MLDCRRKWNKIFQESNVYSKCKFQVHIIIVRTDNYNIYYTIFSLGRLRSKMSDNKELAQLHVILNWSKLALA